MASRSALNWQDRTRWFSKYLPLWFWPSLSVASQTGVAAQAEYGTPDVRPVLIHGQFQREDQVDSYKRLGVFPSVFPMHTFYWGDWHAESVLGQPRADFISPTRAIREAGLMFSVDNGPNSGWGDVPVNEGPAGNATNQVNEPGIGHGDRLHHITGPGYYGGHANPTRSNPNNTFNATGRSSAVSHARYTTALPPRPSSPMMR